jgi:sugar phosphate isomerase/epimerase
VGYKAADYFRKFPGRFISAHLQDYSTNDHNKQIILGEKGLVDWKDFFEAAKVGGLKWVYVEMESDPGTLEGSVKYLKTL